MKIIDKDVGGVHKENDIKIIDKDVEIKKCKMCGAVGGVHVVIEGMELELCPDCYLEIKNRGDLDE